jgi:hypothetical protein
MATVFISYETTTGLEFAKHLQKALGKYDMSSFVAKADISFGKDPTEIIHQNLEECRFFVPIFTITALKSPEVRREFQSARKLGKRIIPFIKEGVEDYVRKEFKDILDFQYATFENKEDLANTVIETVLKEEISHLKDSLRRLKEPITREYIVDSLLDELIFVTDEIYFWLTEPDVNPNEQYVFRTPIDIIEKRKKEELQKIKKDIIDHGFTLMVPP